MAASLAAIHEAPVIAADHSLVERPARGVYGPEDYLAMTRKVLLPNRTSEYVVLTITTWLTCV